MRIQEERRAEKDKRCGTKREKRKDREQWKKERILFVEILGILPIIVEI